MAGEEGFILPIDMDVAPLLGKLREVSGAIEQISVADAGGGEGLTARLTGVVRQLREAAGLAKSLAAELQTGGGDAGALAQIKQIQAGIRENQSALSAFKKEMADPVKIGNADAVFAKMGESISTLSGQLASLRAEAGQPLKVAAQQTLIPAGEPTAPLVLPPTAVPPQTLSTGEVAGLADRNVSLAAIASAEQVYIDSLKEGTGQFRGRGLAQVGFQEPLQIVQSDAFPQGHIDDGHHRLVAAQQLGLQEVPVEIRNANGDLISAVEFRANAERIAAEKAAATAKFLEEAGVKLVAAETEHSVAEQESVGSIRERIARKAANLDRAERLSSTATGETVAESVPRPTLVPEQTASTDVVAALDRRAAAESTAAAVAEAGALSEKEAQALVVEGRTFLKNSYKTSAAAILDEVNAKATLPVNPTPPRDVVTLSAADRARGNGAFDSSEELRQLDPNSPLRRDKRFFSAQGATPEGLFNSLGGDLTGADAGQALDKLIRQFQDIKNLEAAARPAVDTGFTPKNAPNAKLDAQKFLESKGFTVQQASAFAPAVAYGGSPQEAAKQIVQTSAALPPEASVFPEPVPLTGFEVAQRNADAVALRRQQAQGATGDAALFVEPSAQDQAAARAEQRAANEALRQQAREAAQVPVAVSQPELAAAPPDERLTEATGAAAESEKLLAKRINIKVEALDRQTQAVLAATTAENSLAKAADKAATAKADQADKILKEAFPTKPVTSSSAVTTDAERADTESRAAAAEARRRLIEYNTNLARGEPPVPVESYTKEQVTNLASSRAGLQVNDTRVLAAEQEMIAGDLKYAEAVAKIRIAHEKSAAAIAQELLKIEETGSALGKYSEQLALAKTRQAQLDVKVAEALAGLTNVATGQSQYVESLAALKSLRAQEAAGVQQILAADATYATSLAEEANARRLIAADTKAGKLAGLGLENSPAGLALAAGSTDEQRRAAGLQGLVAEEGHNAAIEASQKAEIANATIKEKKFVAEQRILAGLQTEAQLESETADLTKQFNREESLRVAALQRATFAANKAGLNGPKNAGPDVVGTKFQQFQSSIASREGNFKDPTQFLELSQFLKSRFLTTAGFAVSGIATYAAFAGVQKLVTDSTALEKVLQQIKAEFTALGQGANFESFRNGIISISKDTGEAAKDVAALAIQFKGAFGATLDDTQLLAQVRSAVELARVTGVSLAEIENSLTGAAVSFGTNVSHVGDIVIGLQDVTGVAAKESIAALAAMSVTANDIGLSIEQTLSIVDVAAKYTGQSGTTIAEGLNRILPGIGTKAAQIVQLFQQANPSQVGKVSDALAAGDTGAVFDLLGRSYDSLNKAQQNYLVSLLGGQRNAKIAIDVFSHYGEVLNDVGVAQNSSGRLAKSYADLQDTLSQQLARALAAFKSIGAELLNLGLSEIIQTIAKALGVLIGEVSSIIGFFGSLNQSLGGIPAKLAEVYLGLKLITALGPALSGIGLSGVASAAGTVLPGSTARAVNRLGATQAEGGILLGATTAKEATSASGVILPPGVEKPAAAAAAVDETALLGFGIKKPFQDVSKRLDEATTDLTAKGSKVASAIKGAGSKMGDALTSFGSTLEQLTPILAIIAVVAGIQSIVSGFGDTKKKLSDLQAQVAGTVTGQAGPNGEPPPKPLSALDQYAIARENARDPGLGLKNLNPLTSLHELGGQFAALGAKSSSQLQADVVQQSTTKAFASVLENSFKPDQIKQLLDVANKEQQTKVGQGGVGKANISEDDLKRIAASGTTNDVEFKAIIDLFTTAAKTKTGLGKAYEALVNGSAKQKKLVDDFTTELKDLPTLQIQQSTGEITSEDFVAQTSTLVDNTKKLLADAIKKNADPTYIAGLKTSLDQETSARQQVLDARIKGLQAEGINAAALSGANPATTAALTIAADIAALKTPDALTSPSSVPIAQEVVKAQQQQLQYVADHAKTAKEAQAILNAGFKIDPVVLQELQIDVLRNLPANFDKTLKDSALRAGKDFEKVIQGIVTAKGGIKAGIDAYIVVLRQTIAKLAAVGGHAEDIAKLNADISSLQQLANSSLIPTNQGAAINVPAPTRDEQQTAANAAASAAVAQDPLAAAQEARRQAAQKYNDAVNTAQTAKTPEAKQAALVAAANARAALTSANNQVTDAQNAIATSYTALAASQANGDPVKQAQAAIDAAALQIQQAAAKHDVAGVNQAQAAMNAAQLQFQQALQGIASAQVAILQAQADGNPIKAAQASIIAAQVQAQNAHGEAERLQAVAAEITAQHALRDAMNALADAQESIVLAVINAAGDTVGAANETLKHDKDILSRYLAQHSGATVKNDPTAAGDYAKIIQDQAAARDALLQKQEGDIQFQLDINKISTGQAISQLQNLLSTANITEAERQTIERQLYSLKQQITKDLQFNLPTDLKLPTLYEARRFNQSGGNYQDNRVFTITLSSNNKLDQKAALATITDAINSPPRGGIRPGTY